MRKKGFIRTLLISGAVLCILAACTVGLGESVDTKAPEISIEYPSANSYVKGDVEFGGKAGDDYKLASVSIVFHQTDANDAEKEDVIYIIDYSQLNGNTWKYTIKTGDGLDEDGKPKVCDGVYEVTVKAVDAVGRVSEIKRTVTIDNKAPTVLVTTPSTYGGTDSTSQCQKIDIKGSVWDATTLTEVKIHIYDENGSCMVSKEANGLSDWSVTFSDSELAGFNDKQTYYFFVKAKDSAGNENTYFYHKSDIYKLMSGTGAPVSENAEEPSGTENASSENSSSEAVVQKTQTGSAESSQIKIFPSAFYLGQMDQGYLDKYANFTAAQLKSVSIPVDVTKEVLDALKEKGESYPDFVFETTARTSVTWSNIGGKNPPLSSNGSIAGVISKPSDDSSVFVDTIKVTVKIEKTGEVIPQTVKYNRDGDVVSFTVEPRDGAGNELKSGNYTVKIMFQTNSSDEVKSSEEAFSISTGLPSLTETQLSGTGESGISVQKALNDADFAFGGKSLDSNGEDPALLRYRHDKQKNPDEYTEITVSDGAGNSGDWTLSLKEALGDNPDDGTYTFTFEAYSAELKTTLSRIITLDTEEPEIEISDVVQSFDGTELNINGTVNDATSGVQSVKWQLMPAGEKLLETAWDNVNGKTIWKVKHNVLKYETGNYVLYVRAEDAAGNVSVAEKDFFIDKEAPKIGEISVSGTEGEKLCFRKNEGDERIKFSATVSDDMEVCSVEVYVNNVKTENLPVFDKDEKGNITYFNWIMPEDSPDGKYIIKFEVTDLAEKSVSEAVTIQLDTVKPEVKAEELSSDEIAVKTESRTFSVTYSDVESGVKSAVWRLYNGTEWSEPKNISDRKIKLENLTEGDGQKIEIAVTDNAGNENVFTSGNIIVDRKAPLIKENVIAEKITYLNKDASYNILSAKGDTVIVSDEISVKSIEVTATKNNMNQSSETENSGLWYKKEFEAGTTAVKAGDIAVPLIEGTPVNNGEWKLVFKVTDRTGNSVSEERIFTVDAGVPSVTEITDYPEADEPNSTDSYPFRGTASDEGASGIAFIEYSLDGSSWVKANGKASWTALVPLAEGAGTIYVRAADGAGNVSEVVSTEYVFDKTAPEVSVTESFAANSAFSISGTASDTWGLAETGAVSVVQKKDGKTVSAAADLISIDENGKWEVSGLPVGTDGRTDSSPSDGKYEYTVTVTDKAGKTAETKTTVTLDTEAPVITLSGFNGGWINRGNSSSNPLTINGSSPDNLSGLAEVAYCLDGGEWVNLENISSSWTFNIPGDDISGLSESGHEIQFRVKDKAGNAGYYPEEDSIKFYTDYEKPVVTLLVEGSVRTESYVTNGTVSENGGRVIVFSGTARDDAATEDRTVESLSLKCSKNGTEIAVSEENGALAFNRETGDWIWAMPVNAEGFGDGIYTVSVTAKDQAGNEASLAATVQADTEGPVINPVNPGSVSGEFTLTVSAYDTGKGMNSTSAGVWWSFEEITGDAAGEPMTKTSAGYSAPITAEQLGSEEGERIIYIKANDDFLNETDGSILFYVDTAYPELEENNIGTSGKTVKDRFILSGFVKDTNALDSEASVTISSPGILDNSADDINISLRSEDLKLITETEPLPEEIGKICYMTCGADISKADGSWYYWEQDFTPGREAGELADGSYVFTVTAKDIAGKQTSVMRNVTVDKTLPVVHSPKVTTTGKVYSSYIEGEEVPADIYYGSYTVAVEVSAEDNGSEVETVEYNVAGEWLSMKVSGTKATAPSVPIEDGSNTILFRATDRAGNVSAEVSLVLKGDFTAPVIPSEELLGSRMTNSTEYTASFTVTDSDGSGVSDVKIKAGSSDFTSDYITAVKGDGDVWTAVIPTDNLNNTTVYVQATDNVGNSAKYTAFQLSVDTEAPKAAVSAPAEVASGSTGNATVNKKITLKGTASDTNLKTVTVEYTQDEAGFDYTGAWLTLASYSESEGYSWEKELDTTDEAYAGSDKIYIRVTAEDKAGNKSGAAQLILNIDQDSDRPEIMFNNLELKRKNDSKYVWLTGKSNIRFSVSDDDGVKEVKYYYTHNESSTAEKVIEAKNGTFEITLPDDGAYEIHFSVTDKADGLHVSGLPVNGMNDSPKLIGADDVIIDDDTVLYVIVDIEKPSHTVTGYSAAVKKDGEFVYEGTSESKITSLNLGGIYQALKIELMAKDANGIDGVELYLDKVLAAAGTPGVKTVDEAGREALEYIYIDETNEEWSLYTIELPLVNDDGTFRYNGTYRAEVKVTDKANLDDTTSFTLNVDCTEPDVTINTVEGTVKDSLTLSGGINEGKTKIYFALSNGENVQPGDKAVTRETRTDAPASTAWELIRENSYSWEVRFDGASREGEVHTKQLRNYLIDLGFCTETELDNLIPANRYNDISDVYFWIKAEDASGNISYKNCKITVDPQGDRPDVTVTYPATDDLNLGGTITLMGTATDNLAAEYVWLQIYELDASGKGNWNAAALKKALGRGTKPTEYIIGKMSDHSEVDRAEIEALSDNADVSDYAIRTSVTGISWNLQINTKGEFDPEGQTKQQVYELKFYATDFSCNQSVDVKRKITIDSDTPIFVQDTLKLVQYETSPGSGEACTDGSVWTGNTVNTMDYTADVSLKGVWILEGKISDTSGIKTIQKDGDNVVSGTGNEAVETNPSTAGLLYAFEAESENGVYNYTFKIPVGSKETEAVGKQTVRITAYENTENNLYADMSFSVMYDNKVPVVTSVGEKLSIVNTNGFYTFGSKAYEADVLQQNGEYVQQTGVSRVAFFFTNGAKESAAEKVYDIMVKRGETGNELELQNLKKDDGLFWHDVNVISVSGYAVTLDSLPSYAHVGGLVKMNGTVYTIKYITGNVITLDGQPGAAETALIAIACVVDNDKQEGIGSGETDAAGYYKNGAYDDGDHMPESLVKQSTTWTWEANIKSNNIPDGPVTLHYVVFDKAGNVSINKVENCIVQNNGPRIARVKVGTDENGDGTVDEDEITWKSEMFDKGYDGSRKNISYTFPSQEGGLKSAVTAKGAIRVEPEIVGGNGELYYSYNVSKRNSGNTDWDSAYYAVDYDPDNSDDYKLGTGTVNDTVANLSAIEISVKDMLTKVNGSEIDDGQHQKFTFTIWDSTPNTTTGTDSQHADISVIMDVALRDETAPDAKILPFYWNSETDNSLFGQSKSNGHIELSGDLPAETFNQSSGEFDLDPKVSGKIKIEGIARDNAVLKTLSFKLNKAFGPDGAVISAGTLTKMADYTDGTWISENELPNGDIPAAGWAVSVQQVTYGELVKAGLLEASAVPDEDSWNAKIPYASQEFGHVVHWILYLDTAKIDGVTAADFSVTVCAEDYGKPSLADNEINWSGKTSAPDVSRMDVVPYIMEVIRDAKYYNTNRARSGAVSLRRGEENASVAGFNLGTKTNTSIKIVSTKDGSGTAVSMSDTALSGDGLSFTVPETSKSGYLHVVVNNVAALNNMNGYVSYNTETNVKAFDHNELTDDRYVHIWRVNKADTFKGSENANYPAMSSDPDGNLYASFSNYGQAKSYYSKAFIGTSETAAVETSSTATGDVTTVFFGYDPPEDTDISVGSDGKINVFYNANYHAGSESYWDGTTATSAGGIFVYDPDAAKITYNNISTSGRSPHNLYRFELYTYDNELNQFRNARVHRTVVNDEAYVNIAYYDRLSNAVKYSYANSTVTFSQAYGSTTYSGGNITVWTGTRNNRTSSTVYGWTNNTNREGYYVLIGGNYYKIVRNQYYASNDTRTYSYYYTFEGYSGTGNVTSAIYEGTSGASDTSSYGLPWVTIDGQGDSLDKTGTGFSFAGGWKPFKLSDSCFEESPTDATGESLALASTKEGYPVIMYMDAATGVPRIAFADSRTPDTESNWKVQSIFNTYDDNYDTASDYMSCMIDSQGYLHIAFQNTRGQLVYGKGEKKGADGLYDFGSSQVLDDSCMWIDMTMNGTIPYISYLTRVNSKDGMKIAFYDTDFDENNDGISDGGWETVTAALNEKVTNIRTCIEPNAKAADAKPYTVAVGFSPGADYRAAFYAGK